jgi:RNA polymerase sigma-70 factor (ECF subfamily)
MIEANGQACMLMSRDGAVVALATIGASAQGIDQILWMMRPSKLAAISLSRQGIRERDSSNPPPG